VPALLAQLLSGDVGSGQWAEARGMNAVFQHVIKPTYLRARYIRSRLADRRLGILTTDEAVAAHLRVGRSAEHPFPGGVHRAIPFSAIHRLMRRLEPTPQDVLLDYGCGAGRLLCVAARMPFARLIGVEIDPQVQALAARNAQALRGARVRPEIVLADATRYVVPDDVTIAFLYNPFNGEILREALLRLVESQARRPRRIRLVYANPKDRDIVEALGRFRETGQFRMSWRPGAEWARTQLVRLYEMEPRAS
jgi:predicted RNA methylase